MAFLMAVVGIFALISLITALIINALSAGYLRTRFNRKLLMYSNNTDAQNIVDDIQSDCQCCGFNSWLDYSIGQLDTGSTRTTSLTTAPTILVTSMVTGSTESSTSTTSTSSSAETTVSVSPNSETFGPNGDSTENPTASPAQRLEELMKREIAIRSAIECTAGDGGFLDRWILTRMEQRQSREFPRQNHSMIVKSINRQFSVPFTCCVNDSSEAGNNHSE